MSRLVRSVGFGHVVALDPTQIHRYKVVPFPFPLLQRSHVGPDRGGNSSNSNARDNASAVVAPLELDVKLTLPRTQLELVVDLPVALRFLAEVHAHCPCFNVHFEFPLDPVIQVRPVDEIARSVFKVQSSRRLQDMVVGDGAEEPSSKRIRMPDGSFAPSDSNSFSLAQVNELKDLMTGHGGEVLARHLSNHAALVDAARASLVKIREVVVKTPEEAWEKSVQVCGEMLRMDNFETWDDDGMPNRPLDTQETLLYRVLIADYIVQGAIPEDSVVKTEDLKTHLNFSLLMQSVFCSATEELWMSERGQKHPTVRVQCEKIMSELPFLRHENDPNKLTTAQLNEARAAAQRQFQSFNMFPFNVTMKCSRLKRQSFERKFYIEPVLQGPSKKATFNSLLTMATIFRHLLLEMPENKAVLITEDMVTASVMACIKDGGIDATGIVQTLNTLLADYAQQDEELKRTMSDF